MTATDPLELLRQPFPAHLVGKLPRVTCQDCSAKNRQCSKHQKSRCAGCGAYISTAHIHLDFVGHAVVTDRLLDADLRWSWEPLGLDTDGLPLVTVYGPTAALWIRLTVAGMTRLGVGTVDTDGTTTGNQLKELIGDAIRNAAMRFGVALDLWTKEDLHAATEAALAEDRLELRARVAELTDAQLDELRAAIPTRKLADWDAAYLVDLAQALDQLSPTDGVGEPPPAADEDPPTASSAAGTRRGAKK